MQRRTLLLSTACAGMALASGTHTARATEPSLWHLGDEFVDERDQRLRLADLAAWAGTSTVVAMDSAECRFICSTQWRKLTDIQAEADRLKLPVKFIVISLDPANDTPALWRAYRKEKNWDRANWRFLTGNRTGTDRAAAVLGVKWWRLEGHVIHDFRLTRLDAQGRIASAMVDYSTHPATFLGA